MNHIPDETLQSARKLVADGLYGEAADAFREIFDRQPDSSETLIALAEVMEDLGEGDSSLALLADSINKADPSPVTLQRIAEQLSEAGRFEEAADFLLCALSCSPADSSLRSKTEDALSSLGRTVQLEWLRSGAEGDLPSV